MSRERVVIEKRKPLSRRESLQLMLDQNGRCGCGCGVKLDPMGEGVVDEHVIPLEIREQANALDNRSLYRKPCAARKTKGDITTIAKVKRIVAREDGTRRLRKPIPAKVNAWPPKGSVKLPSKKSQRSTANDSTPNKQREA